MGETVYSTERIWNFNVRINPVLSNLSFTGKDSFVRYYFLSNASFSLLLILVVAYIFFELVSMMIPGIEAPC